MPGLCFPLVSGAMLVGLNTQDLRNQASVRVRDLQDPPVAVEKLSEEERARDLRAGSQVESLSTVCLSLVQFSFR